MIICGVCIYAVIAWWFGGVLKNHQTLVTAVTNHRSITSAKERYKIIHDKAKINKFN